MPGAITDPSPSPEGVEVSPEPTNAYQPGDEIFTLDYDSAASFNPLTCADTANAMLTGLLFEGLFEVANDFTVQPVLCQSWSTTDGLSFSFELKSGVLFHDGSLLTPDDVVYSINQARNTGPYTSRLRCISEVYTESGMVKIRITGPNRQLPALLDIPVMKYGTGGDTIPIGTGPYVYGETADYRYLGAFSAYRAFDSLPISRFYLKEYRAEDLISAFEESFIDLAVTNTNELGYVEFSEEYEKRYVETTEMQYLGFNCAEGYCASALRRLILASLVDRSALTDELMPDTAPTVLPVNPASKYYLSEVADRTLVQSENIDSFMISAFVEDFDHDGALEYIEQNQVLDFTLDMIVNKDNLKKVMAARQIAETLKSKGFDVNLLELSWETYQTYLNAGHYDIYYGEVKLANDFNLTELLGSSGSINFGFSDSELDRLIDEFFSSGDDTRMDAAKALYVYLSDHMYIAPLLFEKRTVFTHRGVISNMVPTQQNVFYGITQWSIELAH